MSDRYRGPKPGHHIAEIARDMKRAANPPNIENRYRVIEARLGRLVTAGKITPDYHRMTGTYRYHINGRNYTLNAVFVLLDRLEAEVAEEAESAINKGFKLSESSGPREEGNRPRP